MLEEEGRKVTLAKEELRKNIGVGGAEAQLRKQLSELEISLQNAEKARDDARRAATQADDELRRVRADTDAEVRLWCCYVCGAMHLTPWGGRSARLAVTLTRKCVASRRRPTKRFVWPNNSKRRRWIGTQLRRCTDLEPRLQPPRSTLRACRPSPSSCAVHATYHCPDSLT
jgi:hypothetical protein